MSLEGAEKTLAFFARSENKGTVLPPCDSCGLWLSETITSFVTRATSGANWRAARRSLSKRHRHVRILLQAHCLLRLQVVGRNWNGLPDNPCRVKRIPSPIPAKKWYLQPWVIALMGGLLPFGSIFIEMYFIFTSFWNYKVPFFALLYEFSSAPSGSHLAASSAGRPASAKTVQTLTWQRSLFLFIAVDAVKRCLPMSS